MLCTKPTLHQLSYAKKLFQNRLERIAETDMKSKKSEKIIDF